MNKSIIKLFIITMSVNLTQFSVGQSIHSDKLAHTFSIVARDKNTGEMAVGVQSHWFSVGTLVSWGRSGTGVVATQSFVNPEFGPDGLDLMSKGKSAEETLGLLLGVDDGKEFRQVAFLDVNGNVAAFTGKKCIASAGHLTGDNYAVQANMMLNDEVVPAMAKAFEENDHLLLADRILEVLKAAQEAGGDIRGKQSAALIVVHPESMEHAWQDKKIDLRVDDHANPLVELQRLLNVHKAYEYMNKGDLAMEKGDMERALDEYASAQKILPDNLEIRYWTAIGLANNDRLAEARPIFREIFQKDPNWRELTRRLPSSDLLNVSDANLREILEL